jgi:dTDP-4-dehydrorhamnose reductase
MKRIAILGAGMLGTRLASRLPGAELVRTDITDRASLQKVLAAFRPDAVVNAAGRTGTPNVDWCETHQVETYRANVVGALNVADVCAETESYLLHLGSGCVFYGASPHPDGWAEDDAANPSSFYSRTKYAADLILSQLPHVGVARLRMPIDDVPHPRNLITKLARYQRVVDVANSVTVVDDLINVVAILTERRAAGVFHVTNPGVMRHRDLLRSYRELVDANHSCEFITAEDLVSTGLAAKERSNAILASTRLRDLGISMRPIDEALRDTMEKYAKAYRSPQS